MPPSESAFATPERRGVSIVAAASSEDTSNTPLANINSFSGDPNFMTSLARGLTVIQAFTQKKRQLTISQLSVKTGLSRAAVRRCLYTLAKLGFAGSDDGRHFYLGPRILALGYSYIASMPLATAAQPVLLGRLNLSEGDLIFSGNRYRLQGGTIDFTNTSRTQPVVDLVVQDR